jgi:outer membrane protein assembly factor BamD (BamD/ComL family)
MGVIMTVRKWSLRIVSGVVICLTLGCSNESTKLVTPNDPAKQISEAQLLYDHGLADEAKRVLFAVFRDTSVAHDSRSESLYWLASMAVNEGRFQVAARDFERLAADYAETARGKAAAEMLPQLRQVVTENSRKEMSSPVAQSFMRNGDFWANEIGQFKIDSSWLPKEDMAIEWYDRVIQQFPKTEAAEEAYSKKIRALLGWEDRGAYSTTKYGALRDPDRYLSGAIAAFKQMSQDFPDSGYLQALRYQIAQSYWSRRQWPPAREWLNQIIAAKSGQIDFYVQAAEKRLAKLEY